MEIGRKKLPINNYLIFLVGGDTVYTVKEIIIMRNEIGTLGF